MSMGRVADAQVPLDGNEALQHLASDRVRHVGAISSRHGASG